jgi:hypothetical protein
MDHWQKTKPWPIRQLYSLRRVIVSDLLSKYEERLRERDIGSSSGPLPAPDKFDPDGKTRPLYGLTCIAWIDQESELFQKLCDLQEGFRKEFEKAGLGHVFAFLEPESFHMTICDVVASSNPIQSRHANVLIRQVQAAFAQIGKPGKVTSRIRGIGLEGTITALVKFDRELELKKVFDMEHKIKRSIEQSIGADLTEIAEIISFRPFAGHISLAYCVRDPGEGNVGKIKEILLQYKNEDLGEFVFSQFDLTCFTNMNTFIPILTINLENGETTDVIASVAKHRHEHRHEYSRWYSRWQSPPFNM